jgi:tripartite-type tricarboxylate transporter receptor subunit TctC
MRLESQTSTTRRRLLAAGVALATTIAGFAGAAHAQGGYPTKPITMIVPFSAGGPTDTIARIMAERIRGPLGQTVVIENVTGAAGSIGVGRVARSAPDGYTLSIGHWSTHVVNGAIYSLPYDVFNDFAPISLIASNPQLVISKLGVPASNLKELITWSKANQDKLSVGTAGAGSASHVSGVYFQNTLGARFQFIPYRGAAPALQDLMAGQVDIMFDQAANSLPQVRGGTIRSYAVTAKTRLVSAPDIPTVDEAGLPDFYIAVWHGLWAPKGTPKEVIDKLTAAVRDALADPTVQKRLVELGQDIPPPAQQSPEALAAYHKAEIDKWWPIIKAANIKGE